MSKSYLLPALLLLSLSLLTGCPGGEASQKSASEKTGAPAPAAAKSLPAEAYNGVYEGEGLRLELISAGSGFAGTLTKGGQSFDLEVQTDGDDVAGHFSAGSDRFPLRLVRIEQGLRLTTGDSSYDLKRKTTRNPLEKPNPLDQAPETPATSNPLAKGSPTGDAPGAAPTSTPTSTAGWATFRHSSGFQVRHPADWKVQEGAQGIALLPGDAQKDAQGQPEEMCTLAVIPAQGVTRPDDPNALRFVEQQIRQGFPKLQRQGDVERAQLGPHAAAVLTFGGQAPTGEARMRVFLFLFQGQGVLGMVIGEAKAVTRREAGFRAVLGTVGYEAPPLDQRFVGTWRHTDTRVSSGGGSSFSLTTDRFLELNADGSCRSKSHTMGGGDSGTVDSGDSGWGQPGKWHAANRQLTLRWANGNAEQYHTTISGDDLLLKSDSGKRLYKRLR
ncbi:MAG TPA: hypothetical protein DEA08_25750 [Planctomycetes bacterium]|nr:hypothetical protein [Planctomycetota bacterium]